MRSSDWIAFMGSMLAYSAAKAISSGDKICSVLLASADENGKLGREILGLGAVGDKDHN